MIHLSPVTQSFTPIVMPSAFSTLEAKQYVFLQHVIGCSPYLAKLIEKYADLVFDFFKTGADNCFAALEKLTIGTSDDANLMKQLRNYKNKAALIIALADIRGEWDLEHTTSALSEVAEYTLNICVDYLLQHYENQHQLQFVKGLQESGIIILALGKLGGYELNYSSDVDLVLLFDPSKLAIGNDKPLPKLLNRFAQDLVRLMQERTEDGYVFRIDLRLRPDPSSTPLIINTHAAIRYYESVGQNWERAAFIKARAIAGDLMAGEAFLKDLKPFIWRKSLDFAAINDIQSIKRQMDKVFDNQTLKVAGFDLKKGIGGIREIEFLAQIHQLIWGGRHVELRSRQTLQSYNTLSEMKLLTNKEANILKRNYTLLRHYEHRLQMLYDAQTHKLPDDEGERTRLAYFSGFDTLAQFDENISMIARQTHQIYSECFNEGESLAGDGKLSFTGVSHDEGTLDTLREMGFKQPEFVSHTIQQWHRGSIAAMRSVRARELLTELTPRLLKTIGQQTDADETFNRFSKFFSELPSGVMLLSLLYNNLSLHQILIQIIGNAPQLASYLNKHPDWMDALLSLGANTHLSKESLQPIKEYRISSHRPDEAATWLARYRCEHEFVMGCQILAGTFNPLAAMPVLSKIADNAIEALSSIVIEKFEEQYGVIKDAKFSIVALGRLGSQKLSFGSDLDLLFLYDAPNPMAESNGERSLGLSGYYNRLAQRIIGQLTAMTSEGRLYDVDDRLRPAGKDSPLAISFTAFKRYYEQDAWVFERMALLKNRCVFSTNSQSAEQTSALLHKLSLKPIAPDKVIDDALEMRKRLWQAHSQSKEWQVKQGKGGLIDINFVAHVSALLHSKKHPELLNADIEVIIKKASILNIIEKDVARDLIAALHFQQTIQLILRLCHVEAREQEFSGGLKLIFARSLGLKDFNAVRECLRNHQKQSYTYFVQLIGDYT